MELKITNLSKTYKGGIKAVDNLSLTIHDSAGIDPYNKLIDRDSDDKRKELKEYRIQNTEYRIQNNAFFRRTNKDTENI
ncbi:MAG: hypothetical protein HY738_12630 [Bacteroidia bacterium]|nr:hypothetical protein [Bacteroidia bacterium]